MTAVLVVLAAVLGVVVGSFLNVVIWRVPRGESIVRPPSHCPGCHALISPRDNVPLLSWLALRGRCRNCGERISARYPLVEAGCGALFAGLAIHFGADVVLPAYLYLAAVGLALAAIDFDLHRLPNALTLPSYVIGWILLGVAALAHHQAWRLRDALIGMAALYALYGLLMLIRPGGMGFGDVKLAGVLGLYLGYLGLGSLLVGAFLGFLLGGVCGMGLMMAGRAGRKSRIPFGPYMIAGALVAVFVGSALAHAYHNLVFG